MLNSRVHHRVKSTRAGTHIYSFYAKYVKTVAIVMFGRYGSVVKAIKCETMLRAIGVNCFIKQEVLP